MKLVRELVSELDRHIADYTATYEPDDQLEWSLVLDEIKGFVSADGLVTVVHADTSPVVLSHRLSPLTTPPVERSALMSLTLQEILIVGNCCEQVKFSELTMDMFRMLQTLEREPQEEMNHAPHLQSPGPNQVNGERPSRRDNPHKYLLYKPTLSQVLVFLASGCKELPANGALLLYLSADGCFSTTKHPEDVGYDLGGVLTSSSKREQGHMLQSKPPHEPHCLHPGDLYPFTRRPLFLVVDSDNSFVFQHIPRYFGQPLVTLMSPQDLPDMPGSHQHAGSLFTLFLHSPLQALCRCCAVSSIPAHHWERCQSYVDRFVTEASRLVTRASRLDPSYIHFFGDDFLRLLLLRYVFCCVVLQLHRAFRGRQYRPRCQPPLPDQDLLEHPSLQHLVLDLATHLDVRHHFAEAPGEVD